jgi:hypothetical protein
VEVECCAPPDQLDHNHEKILFVMSNILELNCWVLGDDPRRVFSVEIVISKTVSALKKLIKDEKKHTFDGIDADLLDLWKVSDRALLMYKIPVDAHWY